MVTPQQIITKTNKALGGSKKVRITFGVRNTIDITYLLSMEFARIVELLPMDKAILFTVLMSRDWEHDRNRTLVITLCPQFNLKWFSERMCRALDAIQAV